MSEPVISIITVTKDNAAGLKLTGKSLAVQQNTPRYEWIIINGGNDTNTTEMIESYSELNPIVITEPDHGIYDAMNKAIPLATGRYLWFLNAGDCISDAYTLRDIAKEIQYNMAPDFIYADARENGLVKKARDLARFTWGQITHHQAMLYRRSVVGDLRYDTDYPLSADYAFTLHMIERARKSHYMERVICDFAGGGISHRLADQARDENFIIRRDLLQMPNFKNKFIYKMNAAAWALRQKHPRIYRWLRLSA